MSDKNVTASILKALLEDKPNESQPSGEAPPIKPPSSEQRDDQLSPGSDTPMNTTGEVMDDSNSASSDGLMSGSDVPVCFDRSYEVSDNEVMPKCDTPSDTDVPLDSAGEDDVSQRSDDFDPNNNDDAQPYEMQRRNSGSFDWIANVVLIMPACFDMVVDLPPTETPGEASALPDGEAGDRDHAVSTPVNADEDDDDEDEDDDEDDITENNCMAIDDESEDLSEDEDEDDQ